MSAAGFGCRLARNVLLVLALGSIAPGGDDPLAKRLSLLQQVVAQAPEGSYPSLAPVAARYSSRRPGLSRRSSMSRSEIAKARTDERRARGIGSSVQSRVPHIAYFAQYFRGDPGS